MFLGALDSDGNLLANQGLRAEARAIGTLEELVGEIRDEETEEMRTLTVKSIRPFNP